MHIEARPTSGPDDNVLLLWGSPNDGLSDLLTAIAQLTSGQRRESTLSPRRSIQGVSLIGRLGPRDVGVFQTDDLHYVWELSQPGWDNVAGLLEPFQENPQGFQYLDSVGSWTVIIAPQGSY